MSNPSDGIYLVIATPNKKFFLAPLKLSMCGGTDIIPEEIDANEYIVKTAGLGRDIQLHNGNLERLAQQFLREFTNIYPDIFVRNPLLKKELQEYISKNYIYTSAICVMGDRAQVVDGGYCELFSTRGKVIQPSGTQDSGGTIDTKISCCFEMYTDGVDELIDHLRVDTQEQDGYATKWIRNRDSLRKWMEDNFADANFAWKK